jgi:hypothetical protein
MSEFLKQAEIRRKMLLNSEFLKQAEIRRKMFLINEQSYKVFVEAYESKNEESKKIYDENAELYFNGKANKMSDDIGSIKKNVQFFFWITMISLIISFIAES